MRIPLSLLIDTSERDPQKAVAIDLLENKYGSRKCISLSVYFDTYIFADAAPPYFPLFVENRRSAIV